MRARSSGGYDPDLRGSKPYDICLERLSTIVESSACLPDLSASENDEDRQGGAFHKLHGADEKTVISE